jgi:hypothetical protein
MAGACWQIISRQPSDASHERENERGAVSFAPRFILIQPLRQNRQPALAIFEGAKILHRLCRAGRLFPIFSQRFFQRALDNIKLLAGKRRRRGEGRDKMDAQAMIARQILECGPHRNVRRASGDGKADLQRAVDDFFAAPAGLALKFRRQWQGKRAFDFRRKD